MRARLSNSAYKCGMTNGIMQNVFEQSSMFFFLHITSATKWQTYEKNQLIV